MADFNKLKETLAKVKNITGKEETVAETTSETTTINIIIDEQ